VQETDEIFDSLQKTVEVYQSGPDAALAEDCLSSIAAVRTTVMKIMRNIPTEGPFDSEDLITRPVQLINRLRRHLAMLVQRWDSAFSQSANTVAPKAGQINDAQNQTLRAHSRSSSATSSAHAFQLAPPPEDVQKPSSLNMLPQSFRAPKLVEVTDPGAPTLPKEPNMLIDEAIPTGLVARYISHFEEQEQLNLARANSNQDLGSLTTPRYWGPSTTIDLRGVSVDMELRRTTAADDEIDADFENRLERLVDSLSQLASSPLGETSEERSPRIIQLQSFLTGRPLLPNEADGSQPPVTVYDKEPTSIVAFFLSSKQYKTYADQAKENCLSGNHLEDSIETITKVPSALTTEERILESSLQLDCQMIAEDESASVAARFQMTAYYAPHFAALRQLCILGGEAAYLASIGRCVTWSAQGGKSNVFFAKSMDDRYVIKQLTKSEKQSVLEYAPEYFKYVSASVGEGGKSCLAKIVGIYQVQIEYPNGRASSFGKDGLMDFIIMENLFHACEVQSIYDLKGSERDRYANETEPRNGGPTVLLDDNLRELIRTSPTLVSPAAFLTLQQSLCDDTNFLASLGVMDYSLLVGFDRMQQKLIVGLVDYVRQYTWDKQVESWVKKSGLLGGAGKEPTIISPQQYARRFRIAMLSYFTVVPCLIKPHDNTVSGS
jgi:hypothetical protein